jgi:hypothetical protein
MTVCDSSAQLSKFDEVSNRMFFNIFLHKPDSSVFAFIKRYFPYFTEKYEPVEWTIYPPGPIPEVINTIHSLMFKEHPFFDAKFREGRLDIMASEESDGRRGVTDFQLWFMFDTKKEANNAFKKLSTMFDTLSSNKKVTKIGDKTIAQYSNQADLEDANGIFFILTKDELYENKYKMLVRFGSFDYLE